MHVPLLEVVQTALINFPDLEFYLWKVWSKFVQIRTHHKTMNEADGQKQN